MDGRGSEGTSQTRPGGLLRSGKTGVERNTLIQLTPTQLPQRVSKPALTGFKPARAHGCQLSSSLAMDLKGVTWAPLSPAGAHISPLCPQEQLLLCRGVHPPHRCGEDSCSRHRLYAGPLHFYLWKDRLPWPVGIYIEYNQSGAQVVQGRTLNFSLCKA